MSKVSAISSAKATLKSGAGHLQEASDAELAALQNDPDRIRRLFENGEYPYKKKISRKAYEKQKAALQVELLKCRNGCAKRARRL